jgi:hypothetical protein
MAIAKGTASLIAAVTEPLKLLIYKKMFCCESSASRNSNWAIISLAVASVSSPRKKIILLSSKWEYQVKDWFSCV